MESGIVGLVEGVSVDELGTVGLVFVVPVDEAGVVTLVSELPVVEESRIVEFVSVEPVAELSGVRTG